MTTTRPRTSGLNLQRRQSLRPFYEPFSPNVEEKEEDGAHILRLQLLEFEGRQINVTVEEDTRTIRVTGERPMGNSRWIRLDKTYSIPEDCIIDKINHQFDQGILTISIPKPTPSQAAADPSQVRPIESKEPEKDLPKFDSNKSAVLEKQVSDRVKEELERKLTTKREDSSEVKDQKLIQKEEVNNQIAEKEKGESKTEKEDIKNEISEKDKEESKTAKEEINKQISEKEKEESKTEKEEQISEKEKKESKTEKEEIKKQISEKEKEESKTEKEEIKKQISEKEKKESKTEKKSKEKEKPASKVTRAAKLAGKFAIGRLPWPVKANLAATVVIVAAYFAYTYYRLPKN